MNIGDRFKPVYTPRNQASIDAEIASKQIAKAARSEVEAMSLLDNANFRLRKATESLSEAQVAYFAAVEKSASNATELRAVYNNALAGFRDSEKIAAIAADEVRKAKAALAGLRKKASMEDDYEDDSSDDDSSEYDEDEKKKSFGGSSDQEDAADAMAGDDPEGAVKVLDSLADTHERLAGMARKTGNMDAHSAHAAEAGRIRSKIVSLRGKANNKEVVKSASDFITKREFSDTKRAQLADLLEDWKVSKAAMLIVCPSCMGDGGSCCENGMISPDDLSDHVQLADEMPVAMSAFSTSSLLTRDFQKSAAYQEYVLAKGDVDGHEFHGNQYTAGGGGKTAQVASNSQTAPKTDAERLGNVPGASKALLTQDAIDKFQSGKIDHKALAKAHDALAAAHLSAAKEARLVGDKKGIALHIAAANAHLSAATAHLTADGEGYEPYVDKNGNEVKTEGMSYGELANLPTASDRLSANAADASKAADKHDVEQETAQITSNSQTKPSSGIEGKTLAEKAANLDAMATNPDSEHEPGELHRDLADSHRAKAAELTASGDTGGAALHTIAANAHDKSADLADKSIDAQIANADGKLSDDKAEKAQEKWLDASSQAASKSAIAEKAAPTNAQTKTAQITSEARAVPVKPGQAAQTRDPNWNPRTSGALINMPKAGTQKGFNTIVGGYEKNIPVQLGLAKQAEEESKKAVADGDLETATAKMEEAVKAYEAAAGNARGIFMMHEKFQGQVKQANPEDPKVAAFREQARSIRANEKASAQEKAAELGKKFKEQEAAKIAAAKDAQKIVGE